MLYSPLDYLLTVQQAIQTVENPVNLNSRQTAALSVDNFPSIARRDQQMDNMARQIMNVLKMSIEFSVQ